MKKNIKLLLVLMTLFASCSPWKSHLVEEGSIDEARLNAILDYAYSHKLDDDDRYIRVSDREESDELYCFSIYSKYQFMARLGDTIGVSPKCYFPTKHLEINNKLFLWEDYSTIISNELIDKMHQYDVIDSTYYKIESGQLPKDYIPVRLIDDSKQAVKYFICKKNLSIYKKVISNKYIPKNIYPDIDCE